MRLRQIFILSQRRAEEEAQSVALLMKSVWRESSLFAPAGGGVNCCIYQQPQRMVGADES